MSNRSRDDLESENLALYREIEDMRARLDNLLDDDGLDDDLDDEGDDDLEAELDEDNEDDDGFDLVDEEAML